MGDRSSLDCQRLRRDVELALSRGPDPFRVLPLLHRLARNAEDGSDEHVFAHRQLAEVLLERDPWRAALHARRVTSLRPDDDRGWAALGVSQSLLGNYQFAAHALGRALDCSPNNPWYAHNLGHVLDVAMDQPREALRYLEVAYRRSGRHPDVATSFAHALARAGRVQSARTVLGRCMKRRPTPDQRALLRWLDAGAKGRAVALDECLRRPAGGSDSESLPLPVPGQPSPPAGGGERAFRRWVALGLRRGLSRLPLDQRQRAAASTLARKAALRRPPTDERGGLAIGAASAWAVIAAADIPLSQAEVAACFRVSVSVLRQRLPSVRSRVVV